MVAPGHCDHRRTDPAHLHRRGSLCRRRVSELPGAVDSPRPHRSIRGKREAVTISRRDRRHAGQDAGSRRVLHVDRKAAVDKGAISELAVDRAGPPRPHVPVHRQCEAEVLARRDGCICGEIVEGLDLAQSTVSQHLKMLKEAGLIRGEIDGPRVCYCLEPRTLRRLRALISGL